MVKRRNIVLKRGSLAQNNPELALEWHPLKNGELTANDITVNSCQRVWWQCKKDARHEWEAPINSRNSGVGCPVCSGYKVVAGINDLATLRPEIAREWHPTRNGKIKASDITCGSPKKVWWRCEKGHEWEISVAHRAQGNNCPICANKKILVGYNDLATTNPQIAREWHPTKNGELTPIDVVSGSNKTVWWMCKKGHEWSAKILDRNKGKGCSLCSRELKTSFPEQVIFFYLRQITTAHNRYLIDKETEIDIYLPDFKIGIEYDGIYYHRGEKAERKEKKKEEKLSALGIRLIRIKEILNPTDKEATDCLIYSKPAPTDTALTEMLNQLLGRINVLISKQWSIDIDIPRDRSVIYEQFVETEKERSIQKINPALASEWHSTKNGKMLPEYFSVSSNKKAWWQCEKGHEWQAVIHSRSSGVGCPYCAGKQAVLGENDLATVKPQLAAQWHPAKNGKLSPYDVTVGSNKLVWWQCEKGHEWRTSICDRSRGGNCPICSGRQVLAGYNDLATKNPKLAEEWHPAKNGSMKASDVTLGSDKRVWWQCEKGHEWEAVISSRASGFGCPYCAGQKVIVGFNDLLTLNPTLAEEWHPTMNGDLKPSDFMSGTHKKAWWLGKCGHEWEASIGSRNAGRGCPYCASQKLLKGFNDLATLDPELAAQWHPTKNGDLKPDAILMGSNKKVWWQCGKGHEWEISVNTRKRGNGCPYCGNQIVLSGYNDLETRNPVLASEWHPTKNGEVTPRDVMPNSNKKAWWICENGHEWEAVIASRNNGAGCMKCYHLRRKKNF